VNDVYAVETTLCLNCSRCTTSCPQGAWTPARRGFILWIGGTMGKTPRLATRIDMLIESEAELFARVDRAFGYYREHGRPKERFGHMIDRIGLETVMQEIAGE
jgi:dissimilatory sulfite reductase (desulfoviridin) alpha/beta subunit